MLSFFVWLLCFYYFLIFFCFFVWLLCFWIVQDELYGKLMENYNAITFERLSNVDIAKQKNMDMMDLISRTASQTEEKWFKLGSVFAIGEGRKGNRENGNDGGEMSLKDVDYGAQCNKQYKPSIMFGISRNDRKDILFINYINFEMIEENDVQCNFVKCDAYDLLQLCFFFFMCLTFCFLCVWLVFFMCLAFL